MLKWPGFEVPLPVVSKLTVSGVRALGVLALGLRGDGATALLPPRTRLSASPPWVTACPHSVAGGPGLTALHPHGSSLRGR